VKKRKKPAYFPFRSALEKRIANKIDRDYNYEPKESKVEYTVPHKYTPDFVHPNYPKVYLEVKGYFRTSAEAGKYVSIKRDNPDIEIVFIFNNPFKKAHPNCRPRKDGSLLTLDEWCTKHEFLYYSEKELPLEILKGSVTKRWIKKERKARGYHVTDT
jgi:hypothetical protein